MIRDARPEDAAIIAAIWNPLIATTEVTFTSAEKSVPEIEDMIATRSVFLVAEENGVLGFASYAQFRGGPGYRETMEHTVILAEDARGRGVGRALMATLETRARAAGVRSLIGGVSGSNTAALRFHGRIGFDTVGVIPEAGLKFGRRLDLHLLQKRLVT